MNNKEQKLYLRLLRFALWGEDGGRSSWPQGDWTAALKWAERQAVHGLVAQAIVQLSEEGRICGVSEELMGQCLSVKFGLMRSNQQVNSVLSRVVSCLHGGVAEPLLLKGQGIAQCYPVPELRMPGDIDLYIRQTDEAVDMLRRQWPEADYSNDCAKHDKLRIDGIDIEVHRWLVDREPRVVYEQMERLLSDEWMRCRRTAIGSVEVLTPSPLLNAYFLFYHFRLHYIHDGIGLRQVCDWALCLHRYHHDIDVQRLQALLQESGLTADWQRFGTIAVRYLGLPSTEVPLYDGSHQLSARWILRQILRFGHRGFAYQRKRLGKLSGFRPRLKALAMQTEAYACNLLLDPRRATAQLVYYYLSTLRIEHLYWVLRRLVVNRR